MNPITITLPLLLSISLSIWPPIILHHGSLPEFSIDNRNLNQQAEQPFDLKAIERARILPKAKACLRKDPVTVTANIAKRSSGGKHDFYSEGDYWWPNPKDPDGPFIRRDGETNPDNFVAHRRAMVRLSDIVGTLTSAYIITNDRKYASHAVKHLNAWFVDKETKMNPHLLYGQAIKGRHTGRSIGIIDTIHLVEVARSVKILSGSPAYKREDLDRTRKWFREYLNWINSHSYGLREKEAGNNHGVTWSLQAAAFADLVGDQKVLKWVRNRFKSDYLSNMMDKKGGFPKELKRTKPFGYSLFMIDAMAGVAQIASTKDDNLWTFQLDDGRSIAKGMEFIVPFIKDKTTWSGKKDVQHWDQWPVRHPSLLFAGVNLKKLSYLKLWKTLEPDPSEPEVLRNLPLRYPLLWLPN